jgi:hypothetical protein
MDKIETTNLKVFILQKPRQIRDLILMEDHAKGWNKWLISYGKIEIFMPIK